MLKLLAFILSPCPRGEARKVQAESKIAIAFAHGSLLKAGFMTPRESVVFGVTAKSVTGLAIAFLVLAAFFGALNIQKIKAVRAHAANSQAAQAGKAEADLAQVQKEKADIQAKLDASQQEITSLQKRLEEAGQNAQTADLQSQVDDLRRQLGSAEKEKVFLSEKIQDTQERAAQPKEGKKRRETVSTQGENVRPNRTGVRGTVLAYNQVYNFVVLNLGARHGVESNSEMLVLREGTLIGKIRISSVEPATAIGDIIPSSLARGVQVQPGDTVIYAGTSP
jgi:Skp family chaperone for outer membrane proteins